MLPADGTLRAAQRWAHLLRRSSLDQAAALLKSRSAYTDLTLTQYAEALEWLRTVNLVVEDRDGLLLAPEAVSSLNIDRLLFDRALEQATPAWLPDADTLCQGPDDLPADALGLAAVLGVTDHEALLSVRQVHERIDLAERARVGAAGERALVQILERQRPGCVRHVSLDSDGLGYDIELAWADVIHHLEVKTTTRRGRLTIYLSRHEHEIARLDPFWHLVVIGLDRDDQPAAIATANAAALLARSPIDRTPSSRWESVRHHLTAADLTRGFELGAWEGHTLNLQGTESVEFAWMPRV